MYQEHILFRCHKCGSISHRKNYCGYCEHLKLSEIIYPDGFEYAKVKINEFVVSNKYCSWVVILPCGAEFNTGIHSSYPLDLDGAKNLVDSISKLYVHKSQEREGYDCLLVG